jgi:alpha-tubulin suppressor-like RCC1 family protein
MYIYRGCGINESIYIYIYRGCGTNGRLGHGSHCDEYLPKQIQVLTMSGATITSVAAGVAHSLFLSNTGLVFGCGLDSSGQVGAIICDKDSPHLDDTIDGKILKPVRKALSKFDRYSILCPRPVQFPIDYKNITAARESDVENTGASDECSCTSFSADSVDTVPPEGQKPSLGHDHVNNQVINNIQIDKSINSEVDGNYLRINKTLRTHTISIISCGDFHSAAISHCQRLYTWGSSSKVRADTFAYPTISRNIISYSIIDAQSEPQHALP